MNFNSGGGGPGGGGGRQGGPSRGGGGGGANLFGTGVPGIKELNGKSWKAHQEADGARRSAVVFFYEPGCQECKELKESVKEFGEKFAGAGFVEAFAINCGRLEGVCAKEKVADRLPAAVYYGPNDQSPVRFSGGAITYKSLSQWVPKVMADHCKVVRNEAELRRWLVSDDKVPHVVFFTDRKSVPPLLKTLSLEFAGRAALGAVLGGADADLAKVLDVRERPAMLHILDEDSLDTSRFDKEFKKEILSRFLSRAVGKHRAESAMAVKELTPARLGAGDCAPGDSNFCLLHFGSGADGASLAAKAVLRQLAQRLRTDPVKVFFVRQAGFSKAFGVNLPKEAVVLYRPKRRRFKVFEGDLRDADAIATFVDGAVGGGAPLPEAVQGAPSFGAGRGGEL
mmetsp:Transcript_102969/g.295468  ORF Transcript_102969/g.295468 Transcript_102969/m.295468 type:complete len:397 (-) Transcript_102969:27-1217(-)